MATYPTMQQAQGMDINSILGTMVDRGIWPYYDTAFLDITSAGGSAAVSAQYNFFAIPVNAIDPVTGLAKTRVQTNMVAANTFGATRCFIMEALGFGFPGWLSKVDVDSIIENCFIQFSIDNKVFYEGPLYLWPGGFGLMGAATQTAEESWTLGLPIPQAMRRFGLKFAKYIAPLIPFYCNLYFPTNQPTLTFPGVAPPGAITNPSNTHVTVPIIKAMIDGLTDRSVQ